MEGSQGNGVYVTTAWVTIFLTAVTLAISGGLYVIRLMTKNQINDNERDHADKEEKEKESISSFKKHIYEKFDELKKDWGLQIKELELNYMELKIHKENSAKQLNDITNSMFQMNAKIENLQREVHLSMGSQMNILQEIFTKVSEKK
ncbi:hypothetical protein [Leptospira phage LE3]|uniref:Uncharacterized protein n=2 Tax=Nylescharonvirus TaxID=2843431 RepID=A0A343LEE8_9CAUD|nr:hypothetical protein HWB33_gp47 [Leptospira phage LE3]YP_009835520.1 hypothetical protein HWB34_gp45 [Leptospira phage LE4]ATN94947.1 hypothetical protein [Leptospira phage LE3]ATN95058.1 hypothetical protein [Leptospira phage LE4]